MEQPLRILRLPVGIFDLPPWEKAQLRNFFRIGQSVVRRGNSEHLFNDWNTHVSERHDISSPPPNSSPAVPLGPRRAGHNGLAAAYRVSPYFSHLLAVASLVLEHERLSGGGHNGAS